MFSEDVELLRSISLGYSFRRNGLSTFDKIFVDLVVVPVFFLFRSISVLLAYRSTKWE